MDSFLLPEYSLEKICSDKLNDEYIIFNITNSVGEKVASLTCIVFTKQELAYLQNLFSNEKGRRLGSFLISKMCDCLIKDYPQIKKIELDDATSILPPQNIYYKLGFKVRDNKSNRFINWNTWLKRYYSSYEYPNEERRINLFTLNVNVKKYLFA